MLIIIHVVLALTSLILSMANYFKPSAGELKSSYTLAGTTLLSGVLLIVVNHASVLHTCITGIIFFCIVSFLNETARKKLAPELTEQ